MAQLTAAELLLALTAMVKPATQDIVTNPAAAALLADTGQLAAGKYLVQALLTASVVASLDIEHRNAGNTANAFRQRVHVAASDTPPRPIGFVLDLALNERVRVVNVTAIAAGVVQGTISATRIGDV